jgi:hypothetical protein
MCTAYGLDEIAGDATLAAAIAARSASFILPTMVLLPRYDKLSRKAPAFR